MRNKFTIEDSNNRDYFDENARISFNQIDKLNTNHKDRLFNFLMHQKNSYTNRKMSNNEHLNSIIDKPHALNRHNDPHSSKIIGLLERIRYNQSPQHLVEYSADYLDTDNASSLNKNGKSSHVFRLTTLSSFLNPTLPFYLSTASLTTSPTSSSFKSKNNEMYSIFISMFTAALFLLFIMWRWTRIKRDLRQALREQAEINHFTRQESSNANRQNASNAATACSNTQTSRMHAQLTQPYNLPPAPLATGQNSSVISTHTENLRKLIAQLSNGEPRTAEQHQQIIRAAKYCLQQLKQETGLIGSNKYYNKKARRHEFANRYNRMSNRSPQASTSSSPQASSNRITESMSDSSILIESNNFIPLSSQEQEIYTNLDANNSSLNTNISSQTEQNSLTRTISIELPPAYDTISNLTRSSSLPSYKHCSHNKIDENVFK